MNAWGPGSECVWVGLLGSRTSFQMVTQLMHKVTSTISSAAAAAKSLQLCLTLCNPIDGSPWGSLVPGILQARALEWVAISFSNAWKGKAKVKLLSRVRLLATPWTAAHQAPPSMGFSRQECWSGVPLPSPFRSSLKFITCECNPEERETGHLNKYQVKQFLQLPENVIFNTYLLFT